MLRNKFFIKLLKRFGIPDSGINYIISLTALSKNMKGLPKELFDLNLINLLRGIFTRVALLTSMDWVLPYWIIKQYKSSSKSFVGRGFNLASVNVAHRNWTQVGALDSENEAIVDPRGLIVPYQSGWSLDFWFYLDGKLYAPSMMENVTQSLEDDLPVVITKFSVDNMVVTARVFVEKIDGVEMVFAKYRVKNRTAQSQTASLYISVRPYNVDGMSTIKHLNYDNNNLFSINGLPSVKFYDYPDNVFCSDYHQGDVSLFLDSDKCVAREKYCSVGLATGAVEYKINLSTGEYREVEVRLPVPKKYNWKKVFNNSADYDTVFSNFEKQWRKRLKSSFTLSIPDKKLKEAFDTNKTYMQLFYDVDSIKPGPHNYHHFWFRDAAYLINALDKIGFSKEADNVLKTFPSRQKRNGFFFSQLGEWDSNGQAIWTLIEHYRLTNDIKFLQNVYPSIKKGANWLVVKIKETNKKKVPKNKRGLLPPGLSAEHFGGNDVFYWDDFWALAGFRDAAYAAEIMGEPNVAKKYSEYYEQLLKSVNESLKLVENRLGKPLMPIAPDRRMDSAAVGCLASLYPTRIFSPYDERVQETVKYMEEHLFNGNGFFHDVNHSGFGTYLTSHFAECHTYARSQRAIEILDWLVDVSSSTYTWPESINPVTLGGCIGDGHHGWAAADFLVTVRNMMFFEEENNLVILPSAPKRWFKEGYPIEVANAPSYFGVIAYKVTYASDQVIIKFNNDFRKVPEYIEIYLPFGVLGADADGNKVSVSGRKIIVPGNTIDVVVRV